MYCFIYNTALSIIVDTCSIFLTYTPGLALKQLQDHYSLEVRWFTSRWPMLGNDVHLKHDVPSGYLTQPWYRWPIYRWFTWVYLLKMVIFHGCVK
jgi:hypothetical protein